MPIERLFAVQLFGPKREHHLRISTTCGGEVGFNDSFKKVSLMVSHIFVAL